MGRKAAVITQAEVARTIRAAMQAGASNVEVRPDGVVIVHLDERTLPPGPAPTPRQPKFRDIAL